MASNDNQSRGATCGDAMAHLPWWACVALAGFAYVALHSLALRPYAIVVAPDDVGAALAAFLVGGGMESLQYVVPALCLSLLPSRSSSLR